MASCPCCGVPDSVSHVLLECPRCERARRKFEEISDFSPLRVGDFFSDHDAAECVLQESLAGRGALPDEEIDPATTASGAS